MNAKTEAAPSIAGPGAAPIENVDLDGPAHRLTEQAQ
jgi:hypothetical protein